MKLKLTETFIGKLRAGEIPVSVERPYPGTKTTAANYLLYDETPGTPSGFALRVGKNSATYILDTVVGGKKTKITIGLAKGKSGTKPIISLKAARDQGTQLLAQAHQLGINPLVRAKADHADLMTMGEVWSEYIKYLSSRAISVKPNSLKALEKARKKLAEFDDQKVADIDPERVVELFIYHAKTLEHPTAAEQMGRWAIAAVKKVMEEEDYLATCGSGSSIDALRGHDLRRSFGAACDLLGFDRRQTKFMLGHSPGGDVTDRYMVPSLSEQMARVTAVEKLMLHKTKHMYHALAGDFEKLLEAT